MVFNSIEFIVFFLVLFILYWFVFNKNVKLQNALILVASMVFYACWDWRFLFLLLGITLLNYVLGISIAKTSNEKRKKAFLYTGILTGLGMLLYFKYANFFITSLNSAFSLSGSEGGFNTLKIILPLGISFYTFRTISYLLDVSKNKIEPAKDWVIFFSYVLFFPSLISGPIDKAGYLIPQLEKPRNFDYPGTVDGMRQILWGLFKKIIIADNCAEFTNNVFQNYQNLPSSSLLLAAFLFTIQLYADFSGYSDMALGFSRLLGINVTKNFDFPFFAQNIAEFWRKWHMSLTNWLTEYVFTPLSIAFRDYGNTGLILAIIINFTLIGIWHGANWTFILFGFLHGCYYIPLIMTGKLNKKIKTDKTKFFPTFIELKNMVFTFLLVMFTFIIFKQDTISDAFHYIAAIFSRSLATLPPMLPATTLFFVLVFMLLEWLGRGQQYAIAATGLRWPRMARWSFYCLLLIMVVCFAGKEQQFIYFQF